MGEAVQVQHCQWETIGCPFPLLLQLLLPFELWHVVFAPVRCLQSLIYHAGASSSVLPAAAHGHGVQAKLNASCLTLTRASPGPQFTTSPPALACSFQREGVRFVVQHGGRALIADEMGLGKTVQVGAEWTVQGLYWWREWYRCPLQC